MQHARTLWYHDHGVHHTAQNVFMGLAGMYIMTDAVEQALPLPRGDYDVPLIVSDMMFNADGSLLFNLDEDSGFYGDVIAVNGRPWPLMKVQRRKYRFRILNASVSRSYRWSLSDGRPMTVVATDAGLMAGPRNVTSIRHAPAGALRGRHRLRPLRARDPDHAAQQLRPRTTSTSPTSTR